MPTGVEATTRWVVVMAHAPTAIRIRAAANMLILRMGILHSIPIQLIAYAAVDATLTSLGIRRMSRTGDLVSLVSPHPASIVAIEEIRPVD